MKKIIAGLTIILTLAPTVSLVLAEDQGALLYSQRDRDIALPLSEQISHQSDMQMKRMTIREVPVLIGDKQSTHTVFQSKRHLRAQTKVVKAKTLLAGTLSSSSRD
jgi:hypothetical protein